MTKNLVHRILLCFAVIVDLTGVSVSRWAVSTDVDVLGRTDSSGHRTVIEFGNRGGEPATYQEVLRDPDNIELKLRFARTQINQENFRGASTTLDRILLIVPYLEQVQLLYAVVLFRQDNPDEAERTFTKLSKIDLPDSIRADVEAYLANIKRVWRFQFFLVRL